MKQKGSTLLELIVSIVITAIVLTAVMASYLALVRANQAANISRQLQKEANFAMIRIADKIRTFLPHYEQYSADGNQIGEQTFLSLLHEETGQTVVFEKAETDRAENFCQARYGHKCQTLLMNGSPLFSQNIHVSEALFRLSPAKNPFLPENLGEKAVQLQPKGTLFLKIESTQDPDINLTLQTTISSRRYE
ncbi:prepilin-type N-terminal cleavage/methylation domain-containing protein [Candidatus Gracilibacteria bacterium]|nr:prepilin-type N-terminal cleavage/methylation domain-containing protein [Candidatus Gracilibacteria bacterium]MCF7819210.1 prepilin-type N-terminal cleavage/methylation domain-containing protein [Candidatus Gracilibacteria bacterium]